MSADSGTREGETPDGASPSEADVLRIVAGRAIRRLGVMQYAILGGAALLAVVAGGLLALLVSSQVTLPFWAVWLMASALFLVVPGVAVWIAGRREARRDARRRERGGGGPEG